MRAQLDDLLTYVLVDDFLPKRRGPGRPPRITDAELITLAPGRCSAPMATNSGSTI